MTVWSTMATIRAALLGAGLFSKDVYAGIFASNKDSVELAAVWSRSADAALSFCAA